MLTEQEKEVSLSYFSILSHKSEITGKANSFALDNQAFVTYNSYSTQRVHRKFSC